METNMASQKIYIYMASQNQQKRFFGKKQIVDKSFDQEPLVHYLYTDRINFFSNQHITN